ncbi:metal-sensing transcriptional repressor [Tissierella sp. MSJ-40]|uniref:Metal-sensing transcriptional repressor n=1 Tax=Tissierella simiarum TaxID=2841534 RepID=A0ABS6E2V2_9FIRM|nr:metal-sensing transcriptional repressor [Tissierella simiarum]MBU5437237.1 metal-sensing transcriptional repressor [Tissierella simiarum]
MKADKEKVTRLLKTARGQLDGILKMVEDDRYCIDISNQLMATQAILRNVNREVLHDHLGSCVQEAFEAGDQREKIEEIMAIIDKLAK